MRIDYTAVANAHAAPTDQFGPDGVNPQARQVYDAHFTRKERVERKKGQRYGNESLRHAVERLKSYDVLWELGIPRKCLYNWRDRF